MMAAAVHQLDRATGPVRPTQSGQNTIWNQSGTTSASFSNATGVRHNTTLPAFAKAGKVSTVAARPATSNPPQANLNLPTKPKFWEQKPKATPREPDSSMQSEYEKIFADMLATIEEKRQQIEKLRRFQESVQAQQDIFDAQDLSIVNEELLQNQQTLEQLEQTYQEKLSYYRDVLINMKDVLDKRQVLLEHFDGSDHLLQEHPSLMNYFAEKQSDLTLMFQEICKTVAQ